MLYKTIGLTMKVNKHLQAGNLARAAFYFVARSQRDGRPVAGSAEEAELQQLKAAGYKFKVSPSGDVVCETPDGKYYSGRDALAAWDAL